LAAALGVGPSFVTRLPVSFDGSCSGLQHLCAMTRSPEGELVNLTKNSAPSDLYQVVANEVLKLLKEDAATGTVVVKKNKKGQKYTVGNKGLARLWMDYLDKADVRKVVKRNVMTYFYGSTLFGLAEQHEKEVMDKLTQEVATGKRERHPFEDTQWAATKFFAKKVRCSIEEVAPLPAKAMKFLRKIARALGDENKPVRWTTPTGLPWINRYHEETDKHVRLWLHDKGVYFARYYVPSEPIDNTKSANGAAPNFVHACDAAHLMRVVNHAAHEGITSLATVHDSFGCLANRAGKFRQIIREEFVRMYEEHDVLAEILEQAKRDLPKKNLAKLPELPKYGMFDLRSVLNAEYAFA
jgi:DNA-directed RNA polymerase, mitochondrial